METRAVDYWSIGQYYRFKKETRILLLCEVDWTEDGKALVTFISIRTASRVMKPFACVNPYNITPEELQEGLNLYSGQRTCLNYTDFQQIDTSEERHLNDYFINPDIFEESKLSVFPDYLINERK